MDLKLEWNLPFLNLNTPESTSSLTTFSKSLDMSGIVCLPDNSCKPKTSSNCVQTLIRGPIHFPTRVIACGVPLAPKPAIADLHDWLMCSMGRSAAILWPGTLMKWTTRAVQLVLVEEGNDTEQVDSKPQCCSFYDETL